MRRLLQAFVAVAATLAFASVAYAQDGGAQTIPCPTTTVGQQVITPSGFLNSNCTFAGPKEGGGAGAAVFPCEEVELGSGNVVVTPAAPFHFHCSGGFPPP
jgi:hypothetical protein